MRTSIETAKDSPVWTRYDGTPAERARDVGPRVRDIRVRRNLSQHALADLAGISVASLSMIENGKRGSSITTLLKLADALRVHPAELL